MIGQHRLHRRQFIATDAPGANFGGAGLEVEPPAFGHLAQRDGQRPVLAAHGQNGLAFAGRLDAVLFAVLLKERVDVTALHPFTRDVGTPVIAEQFRQARFVGVLDTQCFDEGLDGFLRCREHVLRGDQA
ncbi:hypothetical protein D3C80_1725430 [compost metagenome]